MVYFGADNGNNKPSCYSKVFLYHMQFIICNNATLGVESSQSGSHATTIIQNITLVSLTSTTTPHRVWLPFGASGPLLDLRTQLLILRT